MRLLFCCRHETYSPLETQVVVEATTSLPFTSLVLIFTLNTPPFGGVNLKIALPFSSVVALPVVTGISSTCHVQVVRPPSSCSWTLDQRRSTTSTSIGWFGMPLLAQSTAIKSIVDSCPAFPTYSSGRAPM